MKKQPIRFTTIKSSLLQGIVILMTTLCMISSIRGQDTFSIVALDSATRQVGSAGASCVDLFWAGIDDPSFLSELIPDTGAINTQSFYVEANQNNARERMRSGFTPQQTIDWLAANDVNNDPGVRQYGIVGFVGNSGAAASYTGTNCINYKNHITGSINGMYYAIQGNILSGQGILDSMEMRFRNTEGNLACRIMASMQGARVVGADTRCQSDNTSSLFAFLKVSLPTDPFGQPQVNVSLKTPRGSRIEPIDSLQRLFDAIGGCSVLSTPRILVDNPIKVYPNPGQHEIYIHADVQMLGIFYFLHDHTGKVVKSGIINSDVTLVDWGHLPRGIYLLSTGVNRNQTFKLIKE
jgi:uncharacterized Ntn-hydrolase superfamily protein